MHIFVNDFSGIEQNCVLDISTSGMAGSRLSHRPVSRDYGHRWEAIAGARLHPLDKGGQGIHIRGLGTKVVPELVLNAWVGVRRCGSLFLDLDSLKR